MFAEWSWQSFFDKHSINYCGEVVKVAEEVTWESLEPGLPPPGMAGVIDACSVCTGGTLHYVKSPRDYLLPECQWEYTKPPRVMIRNDDWPKTAAQLVQRGVCEPIAVEDLWQVDQKPLLNGMFGVLKESHGSKKVHRLIMNLTPANKLFRPFSSDIDTLPMLSQMIALDLEDDQQLLVSSEDIKCMFYLISLPKEWRVFFGFNRVLPKHMNPPNDARDHVLAAKVLPMGFFKQCRHLATHSQKHCWCCRTPQRLIWRS